MIIRFSELTEWVIKLYNKEEELFITADEIDTRDGQLWFSTGTADTTVTNVIVASGSWESIARVDKNEQ